MLCIVPAHDDADFISARILARAMVPEHSEARLVSEEKLAGEIVEEVAASGAQAVCICAVPPAAAVNATYLCKRLRRRLPPEQKIVVALWHANTNLEPIRERLHAAGADEVVTRLPQALERMRLVAPQGVAQSQG